MCTYTYRYSPSDEKMHLNLFQLHCMRRRPLYLRISRCRLEQSSRSHCTLINHDGFYAHLTVNKRKCIVLCLHMPDDAAAATRVSCVTPKWIASVHQYNFVWLLSHIYGHWCSCCCCCWCSLLVHRCHFMYYSIECTLYIMCLRSKINSR